MSSSCSSPLVSADEELVPQQPTNWPAKLLVLFMDTGSCQERQSIDYLSCEHLIEVLCLCLHVWDFFFSPSKLAIFF